MKVAAGLVAAALSPALFLFFCGALAPAAPLAAGDAQPFTTQDLFKLRAVGGAAISPDGSTIACALAVPRDPLSGKDGPGFSELHVVGSDGRSRPFITGDVSIGDLQFFADGRSIAFLAKRAGDKSRSLYAIPVDGGEAKKLFEHDVDIAAFALHPTLRRIAFTATPASPARKDAADRGFSQDVVEEDRTNAQICVADLDVAGAKARALPTPGHPSDLKWSPDGRNLLVALAPDPSVDSSYMRRRLHLVDAATGAVVVKLDHEGKVGASAMSPSGKLVAFIAAHDLHDPQAGRLVVADVADGKPRELLPDFAGHFTSCAFVDETTLAYVADRGCETLFGKIGVDGSGNQEIIAEAGFVVTAFSLSQDGRCAALVAQSSAFPPELFRFDFGGERKRMTNSNPWLEQRQLGAQEVVKYKARDGLELEGVLIHPSWPPGHAPGTPTDRRLPLVVIVHGGPESHFRNGWLTRYSEPGQILAAKGYAVLFPNYRASTGRGVAFSELDHKDPAGKEFDDLVDGVDALVASGLVDKSSVGVTGASYGGYASAWCATKYSDRFAAAVMGFGMSDLLSMLGTSDIPDEHYCVHHEMHPWEDWQLFLERSPIFHAPKSKTPLLILGGKADPRVPPTQSIELYRYLKMLNHRAVRLVLYPGEGHGNARAASRLDYHLRLLQWFDHYLNGPGGAPPPMELDYKAIVVGKPAPQ